MCSSATVARWVRSPYRRIPGSLHPSSHYSCLTAANRFRMRFIPFPTLCTPPSAQPHRRSKLSAPLVLGTRNS